MAGMPGPQTVQIDEIIQETEEGPASPIDGLSILMETLAMALVANTYALTGDKVNAELWLKRITEGGDEDGS